MRRFFSFMFGLASPCVSCGVKFDTFILVQHQIRVYIDDRFSTKLLLFSALLSVYTNLLSFGMLRSILCCTAIILSLCCNRLFSLVVQASLTACIMQFGSSTCCSFRLANTLDFHWTIALRGVLAGTLSVGLATVSAVNFMHHNIDEYEIIQFICIHLLFIFPSVHFANFHLVSMHSSREES